MSLIKAVHTIVGYDLILNREGVVICFTVFSEKKLLVGIISIFWRDYEQQSQGQGVQWGSQTHKAEEGWFSHVGFVIPEPLLGDNTMAVTCGLHY